LKKEDIITKIKNFVVTTIIGGITVILPITLAVAIFVWLFDLVATLISPIAVIIRTYSGSLADVADLLAISIIVGVSFVVGVLIKTRIGGFFHGRIDALLHNIPGYRIIKETVGQLIGNNSTPFSRVALVRPTKNGPLMTGFVTDEQADLYTIFIPTGPNPTSGFIIHVEKSLVEITGAPADRAIRTVISCGAGSSILFGYNAEADDNRE